MGGWGGGVLERRRGFVRVRAGGLCRRAGRVGAVCLVVAALSGPAQAWGFKAHRLVNRLALETLPPDAAAYFRPHEAGLSRMAVEPDSVMRAREGEAEAIRHFINLDAEMTPPFAGFPREYRQAVRRFGKRRLERNGVLPWVIVRFERQLREAIRAGDQDRAMREAAYLGHYLADAFQPLHLTADFDGRVSGATGLHRRFEDQTVERRVRRYGAEARGGLRAAQVVAAPQDAVFEAMFRSYDEVAGVVRADAAARGRTTPDSPAYGRHMDEQLGRMVARQLADAASMLGSLWLTAWQEAKSGRAALDAPGGDR